MKEPRENKMLRAHFERLKNIPGTRLTQAASFSLTMLSANFFPAYRFCIIARVKLEIFQAFNVPI